MKAALITVGSLLAVLVIFVMITIGVNNTIIDRDETVIQAWANVETVLQRRYDLIPNLVNTVKGFASHEKDLLTEVTRLRSQWSSAKASGDTEMVALATRAEGGCQHSKQTLIAKTIETEGGSSSAADD